MGSGKGTLRGHDIEMFLAGDGSAESRRAIQEAIEANSDLKARVQERELARTAFLCDPRRRRFADLLSEAETQNPRHWWRLGLFVPAAGALALVLSLNVSPEEPKLRARGGLAVQAAVLDEEASRILDPTKPLHPGDRISLAIQGHEGGFVTVLIEEAASGRVSVAYESSELGWMRPGRQELPGSLELDANLGRERIYVVVSPEPPRAETWVEELEKASRLHGFDHHWLPAGTSQVSTLEISKVAAP